MPDYKPPDWVARRVFEHFKRENPASPPPIEFTRGSTNVVSLLNAMERTCHALFIGARRTGSSECWDRLRVIQYLLDFTESEVWAVLIDSHERAGQTYLLAEVHTVRKAEARPHLREILPLYGSLNAHLISEVLRRLRDEESTIDKMIRELRASSIIPTSGTVEKIEICVRRPDDSETIVTLDDREKLASWVEAFWVDRIVQYTEGYPPARFEWIESHEARLTIRSDGRDVDPPSSVSVGDSIGKYLSYVEPELREVLEHANLPTSGVFVAVEITVKRSDRTSVVNALHRREDLDRWSDAFWSFNLRTSQVNEHGEYGESLADEPPVGAQWKSSSR